MMLCKDILTHLSTKGRLLEWSFGSLPATSHLFTQVMNQWGKWQRWSWKTSWKNLGQIQRNVLEHRGIINELDWLSWLANIWKLKPPWAGLVVLLFSTVSLEFTDLILLVVSILHDNLLYFIFHGLECVIIQWSVSGFGSSQSFWKFRLSLFTK